MDIKFKILISLIFIIAIIVLLFNPGSSHESINIVGSTSVQPVIEALSAEYVKENPENIFNVQGGGSGMGMRSVKDNIADIGTSSKNLTPEESEGLVVYVLGYEGIVIAVNKENTIEDLSTENIKDLFSGKIKNWKELGGPDQEVHLITREDGSGTRDAFESLVMSDDEIAQDAIVQSSTEAVKQSVRSDKGAIGYVSFAHLTDDVKALTVDGIVISESTISDGSYKLQRPFLLLYKKENNDTVLDFIKWLDSPEAKKILNKEKIVSPP